jgi:hypothetical protein
MGYTTEFSGRIAVVPPLSADEIAYLNKFGKTRRMTRKSGPYTVDGTGLHGQDTSDGDVIADEPSEGQPGYWCQWVPTDDGTAIEWDGGEKFYESEEWMRYIIEHFLAPTHICPLPILTGHICNGSILAQGEEITDRWQLIVADNVVSTVKLD